MISILLVMFLISFIGLSLLLFILILSLRLTFFFRLYIRLKVILAWCSTNSFLCFVYMGVCVCDFALKAKKYFFLCNFELELVFAVLL